MQNTDWIRKDISMEGLVAKWYTTNKGKTLDDSTKLARRIANQLPHSSPARRTGVSSGFMPRPDPSVRARRRSALHAICAIARFHDGEDQRLQSEDATLARPPQRMPRR